MLMARAKQGLGITMLPETLCAEAGRAGELEVVLPEWSLPQGIAHAVFASRRGMLPAVRVFIDFLAERLPKLIDQSRLDCQGCDTASGRPVREAHAPRDAVVAHSHLLKPPPNHPKTTRPPPRQP